MEDLKTGMTNRSEMTVTDDTTAIRYDSGALPVYSTPAMLALMEGACWHLIKNVSGLDTVGTLVNIEHLRACKVGTKVWADAELAAIDGRKLSFNVAAYDGSSGSTRTGNIYVSYGNGEQETFTITQLDTEVISGGEDDFGTFSTISKNVFTYAPEATTDAGWKVNEYCLVLEAGSTVGNWDAVDGKLPVLCGLTDQAGELYSPELEGGCGQLTIRFGSLASNSQNVGFGFRVTVSNGTDSPVTFDVVKQAEDIERYTEYEETQDINLSGTFTVNLADGTLTPADAFTATAKIKFAAKKEGQYAGIIMMGLDYSALVVKRVGDKFQLQQVICQKADKGKPETIKVLAELDPTDKDKIDYEPAIYEEIYLRLTVKEGAKLSFAYSKNGKKFQTVGDEFKMREGKWIGAKFGFLAEEPAGKAPSGFLDIDWIRITK